VRKRKLDRGQRTLLIAALTLLAVLVGLLLWPATPRALCDDPSVRDRPGCTLAETTAP
jgi:hypothetical protein